MERKIHVVCEEIQYTDEVGCSRRKMVKILGLSEPEKLLLVQNTYITAKGECENGDRERVDREDQLIRIFPDLIYQYI